MGNREISEYLSKLGKRGAAKTNSQLTAKQRRESAQKAARARWAKVKKEKAFGRKEGR